MSSTRINEVHYSEDEDSDSLQRSTHITSSQKSHDPDYYHPGAHPDEARASLGLKTSPRKPSPRPSAAAPIRPLSRQSSSTLFASVSSAMQARPQSKLDSENPVVEGPPIAPEANALHSPRESYALRNKK